MTIHLKPLLFIGTLSLTGIGTLSAAFHQGPSIPHTGVGDLLVAPTRLVFEGPQRTAELNLLNISNKTALFRISLVHEHMDEDGKLTEVEAPGKDDKFADNLIRFTPRQVSLEPHVAQIVRVQLRLPASLDTGEYRSHLLFRGVSAAPVDANAPADDQASTSSKQQKELSVKITPIYGVSIPVIVRHGPTSVSTEFVETHLTATPEGEPVLAGKMSRAGNMSVYGNLVVEFAEKGRPFQPIAKANGLAIYTPNATRTFALLLSKDKTKQFHNGTVRATYRRSDADGGQIIAKSIIEVQ